MLKILVVDDTPFDRRLVSGLLSKHGEFDVATADDGQQALDAVAETHFDLVITDLNMPVVDGLELVQRLHEDSPELPTIVMTAYGSEATAMRALQSGAYGYVPKFHLQDELVSTVERVAKATARFRIEKALLCSVVEHKITLSIPSQRSRITPTIEYLEKLMAGMGVVTGSSSSLLCMALEEALSNAVIHGNLEVSSELRTRDDDAYGKLIEERSHTAPYADRNVTIEAQLSLDVVQFVIRDEGPGFDLSSIPDPTNPENLLKPSGRGITLMHAFLDEVSYNELGNEVTLVLKARDDNSVSEGAEAEVICV